jgi:hypothetical protein
MSRTGAHAPSLVKQLKDKGLGGSLANLSRAIVRFDPVATRGWCHRPFCGDGTRNGMVMARAGGVRVNDSTVSQDV